MIRTFDFPMFDRAIAEISRHEFEEQIAAAYRSGDRESFARLGQRLVWTVVAGMDGKRLRPHQTDMYSVGLLALVEQFDKTASAVDSPVSYYRAVVRHAILNWLYQAKIIRRKGSKQPTVILDCDISSGDEFDQSFVCEIVDSRAATSAESCEAADRAGASLCLQTGLTAAEIAHGLALDPPAANKWRRGIKAGIQHRAAGLGESARELREAGFTYEQIGERLGVSLITAYRQCIPRKYRSAEGRKQYARVKADPALRAKRREYRRIGRARRRALALEAVA